MGTFAIAAIAAVIAAVFGLIAPTAFFWGPASACPSAEKDNPVAALAEVRRLKSAGGWKRK